MAGQLLCNVDRRMKQTWLTSWPDSFIVLWPHNVLLCVSYYLASASCVAPSALHCSCTWPEILWPILWPWQPLSFSRNHAILAVWPSAGLTVFIASNAAQSAGSCIVKADVVAGYCRDAEIGQRRRLSWLTSASEVSALWRNRGTA